MDMFKMLVECLKSLLFGGFSMLQYIAFYENNETLFEQAKQVDFCYKVYKKTPLLVKKNVK